MTAAYSGMRKLIALRDALAANPIHTPAAGSLKLREAAISVGTKAAEAIAAKDRHIRELEAESEKLRDRNRALARDKAIGDALKLARVAPGLHKGARRALQQDLRLCFEEKNGDIIVSVDVGHSKTSVDGAVRAWLQSPAGAPFNPPPPPAPTERRYSAAMQQLRELLR